MFPSMTQMITWLVLILLGFTIGFWVCRKSKQITQPAAAMGNPESRPNCLSCSVCFDTDHEVTENGRQWMATTCGHIFCNDCIYDSIAAQRSCPNCRKKLIKRSVRRVYPQM